MIHRRCKQLSIKKKKIKIEKEYIDDRTSHFNYTKLVCDAQAKIDNSDS